MDLKIKDVAELLKVSETTIRRWLSEGKIPAYRLHHQYRFSRNEIEDWMLSQKLGDHTSDSESKVNQTQDKASGWQQFILYRSIHKGLVVNHISSTSKQDIIHDVMQHIASKLSLDADMITELLMDREKLMPTGLSRGIAVPHTRDFHMRGNMDVVVPVFLSNPIDWGSIDGQPVHTLFFLFAADDKRHLQLLAKLSHLASHDGMVDFLMRRPSKISLLSTIKDWEAGILTNS